MSSKPVTDNLFSEFDPINKEEWIEKVITDLKGADFNKKLVWQTIEGFNVQPFYMKEDLHNLDYLKNYHNSILNKENPDSGPRYWLNRERIEYTSGKKSGKLAHEALHMGADAIEFDFHEFKGKSTLKELLSHILPSITPVTFSQVKNPEELVYDFFTLYTEDNKLEPSAIRGSLNYDPLKELSLTGAYSEDRWDKLAKACLMTKTAENFRTITVNGAHFLNSGANTVQEIAFTLNTILDFVDNLTEKGIDIQDIFKNIEVSLAVGTNYFMEIAKLRAFRILFNQVAITSGIKNHQPGDLWINSISSIWTKTIYDPYVNMLRNTTEAMAAILGGCNSLSMDTFNATFTSPTNFSRRISRNISNLLKNEVYFDKVADPAAGSYYVEILTDKLANQSWELFREIESMGGYRRAFEKGIITKKIKSIRDKKLDQARNRRNILVGTNQYPNPDEVINPDEITKNRIINSDQNVLPQLTGGIEFEELRLKTDRFSKENGEENRPSVYLSLIGENEIMSKARAAFSVSFFGCAGFKVTEGTPSESTNIAVAKAVKSQAQIIVICGADDDYISLGTSFAREYKSHCNGFLIIAGYPIDIIDDLRNSGIDDFIHLKVNAIEKLSQFQKTLNIN